MFDPTTCDSVRLDVVDLVCSRLLEQSEDLQAADLMILGAYCRDIIHGALGHTFPLRATTDLDIALAVANWHAYRKVVVGLPESGSTGIRYMLGDVPTDLVPFGPIEDPSGVVVPDPPDRSLSVWGFQEVFDTAKELSLPTVGSIRIPTVPGYTALKLAAWLDRSETGRYKDATDIATCLYWYISSSAISNRLYDDPEHGFEVLDRFEFDNDRAAAYLLGEDIAATVGAQRLAELINRWPGPQSGILPVRMTLETGSMTWTPDVGRREALLEALERGWSRT